MTSRISVKQRLIETLEKEAREAERHAASHRAAADNFSSVAGVASSNAQFLKGRGSGPLPYYFVQLARERGIE